ncbi:MAG: drug/metabolite transporter (DMT)-like permease [Cognaticolwellia sp.]|jgi:drug/metabolite transporter (DMT)-like permease
MMTPVFALYLGARLSNERVSLSLFFGALLVMCGLAWCQWGGKSKWRKISGEK